MCCQSKHTRYELDFVPVLDASGSGLTEVLLKQLKEMEIPIKDMSNGPNMVNPRAFYIPYRAIL